MNLPKIDHFVLLCSKQQPGIMILIDSGNYL